MSQNSGVRQLLPESLVRAVRSQDNRTESLSNLPGYVKTGDLPRREDLRSSPSFAFPYGSTQIVNLRNEPQRYLKSKAQEDVYTDSSSSEYSPSVVQRRPSAPRTTVSPYQSKGRRHPLSFVRTPGEIDLTGDVESPRDIPIDPMLLEYDERTKLDLRNLAVVDDPGSPQLPPQTLRVSVGASSHATDIPTDRTIDIEPSSDATIHMLASSPAKRQQALDEPSSPISRQIQREMDFAGQHDITALSPQRPQQRHQTPKSYPQSRSGLRNCVQNSHGPDIVEPPSSPGEAPVLHVPPVDRLTQKLFDRYLNLGPDTDFQEQDTQVTTGFKIHTYRPYPAVSAQQHGFRTAYIGHRTHYTQPKHSTRAIQEANSWPILWQRNAESQAVLFEKKAATTSEHTKPADRQARSSRRSIDKLESATEVVADDLRTSAKLRMAAYELKTFYPELYRRTYSPDGGFFDGIIEPLQ